MDERAFTGVLLSQLAGRTSKGDREAVPAPASCGAMGKEAPPRILVAADLPEQEAIHVLQEACAFQRFGYRVEALVRKKCVEALERFAPPGTLLDAAEPLRAEAWDWLHAVLAVPTQDQLARLALGLQDSPGAQLVLGALWRGIPVYMDFSCTQSSGGAPCANPAMGALYSGYARQMCGLGAKAVRPGEYLVSLRGGEAPTAPTMPPPGGGGQRRVITQKDVQAHTPQDGVWLLPRDAIITALAWDTAKKQGLTLQSET